LGLHGGEQEPRTRIVPAGKTENHQFAGISSRGFCCLLGDRGGTIVGGLLGLFFGLAFGGALPRGAADCVFGPEEPAEK
jgi:hypothetical protein